MTDAPCIEELTVEAYRIPTDLPEADGTLAWDATEVVMVWVHAGGKIGVGYSYTAALAAGLLIKSQLEPCLAGVNAFDLPLLWQRMNNCLRNTGRPGLGMMAIAAVDQALWDLKAKLLGVPLVSLWGQVRQSVPVYASGGFTSYSSRQLREQLEGWLEQGFTAVKIKLGTGLEEDLDRVKMARTTLGTGVALMVDTNGAYHPRTAMELIDRLREYDVCWLEEPVSSDDLAGLSWLRDRAPAGMAIAAGEYGWDAHYFQRMLAANAVDTLQADATRCGYTGFIQAAHLGEAHHIPLSAHCAPRVHAPLCTSLPGLRHLEYFHDHVRIERLLFEENLPLHGGELWPERNLPGHGLTMNRKAASAYRI